MSWRTTLSLLVIVAALGFAAWWQREREADYVEGTTRRLFDGVEVARVHSIRLEALERPPGVRMERDARGDWFLTDPIAYPARQAMVAELLSIVARNMAQPASPAEISARDAPFQRLGLFEVEERFLDGQARTTRIEVGDVDLDGVRLWVREDGEILRTLRNIETMLQRGLHELRSDRIFSLAPEAVVEIERAGHDLRRDRVELIDLAAHRDVVNWRLERPFRGALDPTIFTLWLSSLTSLKAKAFIDDDVRALGPYGLASPQVTLRLVDRFGQEQEAIFAQAIDGGQWYAHRVGLPYVWELETGASTRFFERPEDFLDEQLVRVFRDDVRTLEVRNEHGRFSVLRDHASREPRWLFSARDAQGAESIQRPAERSLVEDLLGSLEAAELRHLPEENASASFPAGAPSAGVWIEDVHGVRQGGRIGAAYDWSDGTRGFLFARDGEDVVSFVPEDLGRLLELDASRLLSLRLFDIDEVLQRRLVIATAERSFTYFRSTEGVWRHEESKIEATELRPTLDGIFFLRAESHLPAGSTAEELREAVRIELVDARGQRNLATLGRDGEGRVQCEVLAQRSLLADPGLFEDLRKLFAP